MVSDPHRNEAVLTLGAKLTEATAAVILLHGRGASAEDILGLATGMYDERFAYLAPQAAGNSWYPYSFLAPIEKNEPWLSSALAKVATIVQQAEAAGVSRGRIFVCGFSQGACLSSEFVAWNQPRIGAYNPSAIVYGDYYYTLLDGGFITCHDAKTGEEVYGRQRIEPGP